jgi:predicted RNA binding protein YcfA (HicA-like mRNA interferase family)
MPKLPSLTPQKIIKALEKNGFVLENIINFKYEMTK